MGPSDRKGLGSPVAMSQGEPASKISDRQSGQLAVETFELGRSFGKTVAVAELTIAVQAATIFGLLGPNGAGKSTTLKMLTTMLPPTSGTARVVGYDIVRQAAQVRRHIGYVPQLLSADGALTGSENLALFAKLYGIPHSRRQQQIRDALDLMGLTDVADTLADHYSGGMIRRLEIAQSMLHRPPVLFLDEPTVGLDPVARHTLWERLRQLQSEFGTTMVLTTHDLDEAEELCGVVAIICTAGGSQ